MRSLKEIEEGLNLALKSALASFKGDIIDKDMHGKIQKAATEAANDYFKNKITEVEKDTYLLNRPKPEVNITGSVVTIRGVV